jgi:hypothetical protein
MSFTVNQTTTSGDSFASDVISSVNWQAVKPAFGAAGSATYVSPANGLPIAFNTAKDGSGTEYRPLVDADGHAQVDVLSLTGTVTVDLGSGSALTALQLLDDVVGTFGSAIPTKGYMIAGSDGTNARALSVNSSGEAAVRYGSGTFIARLVDADGGDSCMDTTNNSVKVTIVSGGGSGGTSAADKATFTEGTSLATPVAGVVNDTLGADVSEDQSAAVRITPKRAMHVNLRDTSAAAFGTSSNPVFVDPTPASPSASDYSVVRITDGSSYSTLNTGALTDDAAFTPASSSVLPSGFLADETATDSVDEGDIGIGRMTLDRKQHVVAAIESAELRVAGTALTPKFAVIAASSSGDNTVVAAVASKKIRVISYTVVAITAVNAKWKSGASTDKSGLLYCGATGGVANPYNPLGLLETASGEALVLNLSAAVAVGGHLTYVEVP